MDTFFKLLAAVANVFAIIASGIAVYLFVFKRKVISSALHVLLNYSSQISFSEFNAKLERLNDLSADDTDQIKSVINIFNEILGQIRGSKFLSKHFKEIIPKVKAYAEGKAKISEAKKRSIVNELRERLRNINIKNYTEFIGE